MAVPSSTLHTWLATESPSQSHTPFGCRFRFKLIADDIAEVGSGELRSGKVRGNSVPSCAGRVEFECFYLRPTNGRANDQVRRNHSAQYISFPEFPWYRLRKEFPEKYETYADLVTGEWTKIRIEVNGEKARLFVNSVEQPTLIPVDRSRHGSPFR